MLAICCSASRLMLTSCLWFNRKSFRHSIIIAWNHFYSFCWEPVSIYYWISLTFFAFMSLSTLNIIIIFSVIIFPIQPLFIHSHFHHFMFISISSEKASLNLSLFLSSHYLLELWFYQQPSLKVKSTFITINWDLFILLVHLFSIQSSAIRLGSPDCTWDSSFHGRLRHTVSSRQSSQAVLKKRWFDTRVTGWASWCSSAFLSPSSFQDWKHSGQNNGPNSARVEGNDTLLWRDERIDNMFPIHPSTTLSPLIFSMLKNTFNRLVTLVPSAFLWSGRCLSRQNPMGKVFSIGSSSL